MKSFDEVTNDIKIEFEHQDAIFNGNDRKPLEIWMILANQYMADAMEKYTHSTQDESRKKLLKSIACGFRALMSDKATY